MCWAETLERGGFNREIAGYADFTAAVKVCKLAFGVTRKGIIVAGEYGVGKSCLVKAIAASYQIRPRTINLADSRDL